VPPTSEALGYDGDGNRVGDSRWTLGWDGLDRLTTITETTPQSPSTAKEIDCVYDLQGRRAQKTVKVGGAVTKVTTTLWDGWRPVMEIDRNAAGTALAQRYYTWGPDVSGDIDGEGGIGGLVEIREIKGPAVTVSVPMYDGIGNVTGLVDEASGQGVASYTYGPFGEVLGASGPRAQSCPFRYQTKLYDSETGYYYFGKRYYDPTTLTWLSRDPIREDGGVNLYAYCGNDPVGNYDAVGLAEWTWIDEIGVLGSLYFWEQSDPYSDKARGPIAGLRNTAQQWGGISVEYSGRSEALLEDATSGAGDAYTQTVDESYERMLYYHDDLNRGWFTSFVSGNISDPVMSATGLIGMMEGGFGNTSAGLKLGDADRVERFSMGTFQLAMTGAVLAEAYVRAPEADVGLSNRGARIASKGAGLSRFTDLSYVKNLAARAARRSLNRSLGSGLSGRAAGAQAEVYFEKYAYQLQQRLMAANSPFRITLQPAALDSTGARVLARTRGSFSGRWVSGTKRLDYGLYDSTIGNANSATILNGADFTVTLGAAAGIPAEYQSAFPFTEVFGIDPGDIVP